MQWFNKNGPTTRKDRQRFEDAHRKRRSQKRFGSGMLGFFGMLSGLSWREGIYRLAVVSSGFYVVFFLVSLLGENLILRSIRHGVGVATCFLWLAWLVFLFGPIILQAKRDRGIRFLEFPVMLGRYIRDGFFKQDDTDKNT